MAKTAFDAHILHRVGEQVPGAAIEIRRRDEVIARARDILDCHRGRRLSGRDRQRSDAAFEGRDTLFEDVVRRVHDPGVDIAHLGQAEQVGGMFGAVELV